MINHLRFADDIVVIASSEQELKEMLDQLCAESAKVGLKMNMNKTKIMNNKLCPLNNINVNGEVLQKVENYIYLGHQINCDNNNILEINRRIGLGWAIFGKHREIFKSNMPISLKTKLYNQVILPVITYGSETWTLTKESITKLQVAQRAMERQMLGISLRDRKENIWVREQTKVLDIIESIKWNKWKWAGHIQRMTDERWTKTLTNWRPWY